MAVFPLGRVFYGVERLRPVCGVGLCEEEAGDYCVVHQVDAGLEVNRFVIRLLTEKR
jgi:hypothetical protein